MSKTIYDVTLLDLLPPNLKKVPEMIAFSAAVSPLFQYVASKIAKTRIYCDIDNLDSDMVDQLAAEMRVDFYDQSLPLESRKALVKNGYLYKFFKGTAWAVEQLAKDAFGNVSMAEWFDYGGVPYHFALVFDGGMPDVDQLDKVASAINRVKNVRSCLDGAQVLDSESKGFYVGCCAVEATYETITQLPFVSKNFNSATMLGVIYDYA